MLAGIIFRYRPSVMTCRLAGISLPTKDVLAIRFNPETKQRTLDTLRWRADSLLGKRSQDRRQDNQCAGRRLAYEDLHLNELVAQFDLPLSG